MILLHNIDWFPLMFLLFLLSLPVRYENSDLAKILQPYAGLGQFCWFLEKLCLSDSFSNNLLDHPHYTKPRVVNGQSVPDVLLNGHHKKIKIWRKNKSEKVTKLKRPDLWEKYNKSFK